MILNRLVEKRATLREPNGWLMEALGGTGRTAAGITVNARSAMSFSPVFACVRIIAETVACLPFWVYERKERGKDRAADHAISRLIHDQPNSDMTAPVFWETTIGHAASWGNGVSRIVHHVGNPIPELVPILPDKLAIHRDERGLTYTIRENPGEPEVLRAKQVFHIPGFGFDGVKGYSALELHRNVIGLGLAVIEQQARFYGQGANPGGILKTSKQFKTAEAVKRLRDQFVEVYSGTSNSWKPVLLEDGMEFVPISIPAKDMETVNILKLTDVQIARLFRMPLHKIQNMDAATFSNIEHQAIEFVQDVVLPWTCRVAAEVNRKLLPPGGKFFAEHTIEGLLRGDIATRSAAHATALQNGWRTPNEVRIIEGLNPLPGGDELMVQKNMQTLEQLGETPEPPPEVKPPEPDEDEPQGDDAGDDDERMQRRVEGFRGLFEDAYRRVLRLEQEKVKRAIRHAEKRGEPASVYVDKFYGQHGEHVRGIMGAVVDAMSPDASEEHRLDYTRQLAERHVQLSRTAVVQALGDGGVDALFDKWADRPAALARQEVEQLMAAVKNWS